MSYSRTLIVSDSVQIKELGYDLQSNTLRVVFFNNDVYLYDNIPPQIFAGLAVAKSVGSEFHRSIKSFKYPYRKAEP